MMNRETWTLSAHQKQRKELGEEKEEEIGEEDESVVIEAEEQL